MISFRCLILMKLGKVIDLDSEILGKVFDKLVITYVWF